LILRKIIKTVATRCHILKLKCTKFDFGWRSAPDPAGGAYREGKGKRGRGKGGRKREGEKGKEEGKGGEELKKVGTPTFG